MSNPNNINSEVTQFLDKLSHPLRKEIDLLRNIILTINSGISENIKWNAPNYVFENSDRITMRIQPPKQIQLIFHRGAKVLEQPKDKLINDDSGMLVWKTNDRAIATFRTIDEISLNSVPLVDIVTKWLDVK
jgi:uncharacterized protein YdeI (YjbR/CyaY-like superfamily)